MRHHSIAPLRPQQRTNFGARPCAIVLGNAQRAQRGIPIPLMRVLAGRGLGKFAHIVQAKHRARIRAQRSGINLARHHIAGIISKFEIRILLPTPECNVTTTA
jgi:hypothetical protein